MLIPIESYNNGARGTTQMKRTLSAFYDGLGSSIKDVRKKWEGVVQPNADKCGRGEGVKNVRFFADVL